MSKPIYWAIGAGVLLAVVWVAIRNQEPEPTGPVSEVTAEQAPASLPNSSDEEKPEVSTRTRGTPSSAPEVTSSASAAATAPSTAGNAIPIDVSPGFEYLSKPAAEMKDTSSNWGPWRRHQKLASEPRDEAWAQQVEVALRNGIQAALTAKGLDTQRIELPVVECRTTGCEIQAIGYVQDSQNGGFDFQEVLNGLLRGPLGNEFNLDETSYMMTSRPDNRVTFLTHLPRKET
jgi:hypothetical protein